MKRRAGMAVTMALATISCATVPSRPAFTAAQVAVLKAEGFAETPRGWELSVNDRLLFASDDAEIDPGNAARITRLAAALSDVGIARLRVEGHADATGTAAYNRGLSEARAKAVADRLATGRITRSAIQTLGLGETIPIESNATREGRAENRRVVIIVPPQG